MSLSACVFCSSTYVPKLPPLMTSRELGMHVLRGGALCLACTRPWLLPSTGWWDAGGKASLPVFTITACYSQDPSVFMLMLSGGEDTSPTQTAQGPLCWFSVDIVWQACSFLLAGECCVTGASSAYQRGPRNPIQGEKTLGSALEQEARPAVLGLRLVLKSPSPC